MLFDQLMQLNDLNKIFLESAPLVMNIWDKNAKLIRTSKQAVDLFGLSSMDEYIEKFHELSPEFQPCGTPSKKKALTMVNSALKYGKADFSWVHQDLKGNIIPMEINLVRYEQNGEFFLASYATDLRAISERADMEMELKTSRLMDAIVESSPFSCVVYDENLDIVDINQATVELHGLECKEDYQNRFFELCPPYQPCGTETKTKLFAELKKAMAEGTNTVVWMFKNLKDGSPLPVECVARKVTIGSSSVLIIYARDLRESYRRREAEELTKQTMSRQLQIYNSSPIPSTLWSSNFEPLDCNEALLKLLEIESKDDFLNRFLDFNPKVQSCGTKTVNKINRVGKEVIKNGIYQYKWTFLTSGGEVVEGDCVAKRIDLGDTQLISVYFQDMRDIHALQESEINALKDAEKKDRQLAIATESDRAKSKFLARMSHEIRTPITAVMGISEAELRRPKLPAAVEASFAKIHDASILLLGIINDILDLSKIEAGKLTLIEKPYEIEDLIGNVVHLHDKYISSGKVKFILSISRRLPNAFKGDPLRLKQILNNLVSNAFKYTTQGEVELTVSYRKNANGTTSLVFIVRDTGHGMNKEQVDSIFSEFTRFHETVNKNVTGTGMGMPIVQSLVKLMGGTIQIGSKVNSGTTVIITIPQEVSGNDYISVDTVNRLKSFEPINKKSFLQIEIDPMPYGKVLVVDDIESNLYVINNLLSFYDIYVETCTSGPDVIKKIEEGNVYDIIFMDHMMPGMNGEQAMWVLRNMGYSHPIIVLTANAVAGLAKKFIENGFDEFLSKPIDTKQLNDILNRYVRDKQSIEVIDAAKTSSPDKEKKKLLRQLESVQQSEEMVTKLRSDFSAKFKNSISESRQLLKDKNHDGLHILVHTIKGMAAMINEDDLAQACRDIEDALEHDTAPPKNKIAVFEMELLKTLDELGDLRGLRGSKLDTVEAKPSTTIPHDVILPEIEKIIPLLQHQKAECLNMLDFFRNVPEAAIMVKQIEKFDFAGAAKSAVVLQSIFQP